MAWSESQDYADLRFIAAWQNEYKISPALQNKKTTQSLLEL